MPKVSVIIPVYNVENYLKRALDSVINQTLKDIEIICIDDKSSDNSLKILEEYARTYANIKILRFSRNKGVAKARNEGIRLATGEYIAFLDPDDYVDTNFYEALYNVTIIKDVDIVKGGKKTIDISGNTKDSTLNQLASQNKYNFTYEFWTALYKTSFIKCNNFDFPENIINGEDCVFLLKCILNTDKIEIINEVYYYYCKRIDSLNAHFLSLSSILSSINSVKERLLYINNSKLYNYDKNSYIYVFNQHLSMHIWNYYQCKSFVAKYLFSKSIITFYYLCKDTNMLSKIINRKDILKFIKKRNVLELELYLNNEIKNNITQTPIYSSGYIPIVLASDENQCKQMYITILSALSNKKKKSFYDFFLLVPELFPKTILKQFKKFEKKYNNCRINFIEMGNSFSKLEMRISHITTPTYYRLKIADVLPDNYKKAIYLDTDVIVLKDLAEFFNTDLSNYYIAGVKAAGYIINTDNRKYYEEIGISDLSNYINAGVTLWNLDKIRSDNMTELMLKLARNNYKSQDQDVINIAFFGHIKILSARYNLMTKYEKGFLYKSTSYAERLKNIYSEDNFENLISNTLIIHYADKIKPWNDSEIWLGHYWWKYAQKSRLFKRQQNIMSKYFQNIFSVKNDNIHKVITILGIKMKFKNKKLIERQRINNLEDLLKKTLSDLQQEKNNNQRNINLLKKQNDNLQSLIEKQQKQIDLLKNEQNATDSELKNLKTICNENSSYINTQKEILENTQKQIKHIENIKSEINYIKSWQQNFYKDIPDEFPVRLSDIEKQTICKYLKDSENYLEFGSGGSTFLALENSNANVFSVESDKKWLDYLLSYKIINNAQRAQRLKFYPINIGEIKGWGYPVNDNLQENYPNYSAEVFRKIDCDKIDTVLIDGRFRVACTIQAVLNCSNIKYILIHDYIDREFYHTVEEFLDKIETIDTLAVFKVKENIDYEKLKKLYDECKYYLNEYFVKIPIVFASDQNYLKYTYIAMLSALENKNTNTFYDFYILIPKVFDKETMLLFESLSDKYKNCKINFIEMGAEFLGKKMQISHITSPIYYRLKLAEILPQYERAIYMDSDVIVLKDLSEYFNLDLGKNYIAGVKAAGYILNPDGNKKLCEKLGIKDIYQYINAGVTLWNLEQIRQDNIQEKLIKLSENDYSSMDQDIINIAFYDNILHIPYKYNVMTKYKTSYLDNPDKLPEFFNLYGKENMEEALKSPVIIHYADKAKPWNSEVWLGEYWLKYAKRTPYYKNLK